MRGINLHGCRKLKTDITKHRMFVDSGCKNESDYSYFINESTLLSRTA